MKTPILAAAILALASLAARGEDLPTIGGKWTVSLGETKCAFQLFDAQGNLSGTFSVTSEVPPKYFGIRGIRAGKKFQFTATPPTAVADPGAVKKIYRFSGEIEKPGVISGSVVMEETAAGDSAAKPVSSEILWTASAELNLRPIAGNRPQPFIPGRPAIARATPVPMATPDPRLPKPTARIEVKNVGNGNSIDTRWQTDYGSFDKAYLRKCHLTVELGTVGRQDFPARLQWIFVGKRLLNSQRIAVAKGTQDVVIHASRANHYDIMSGGIASEDTTYVALGERYVSGTTIEGWLVRVVTGDGAVVATQASADYLDQIARDPAKFDQMAASQ